MKKIKARHIILIIVFVLTASAAAVSFFAPQVFTPVREFFTGKSEDAAEDPADNGGTGTSRNAVDKGSEAVKNTDSSVSDTEDNSVSNNRNNIGESAGDTDLSGYSELFSMYASSMAESPSVESVDLPESETVLSLQLAREALTLCSGGTKAGQAGVLMNSGFELLMQDGYDKAADDISHTCAFSVGRKDIVYGGGSRELLVVAIRGTSGSEWFSNFDYADSRSEDSLFAENFLQAAQTINIKLIPVLTAHPDALILVCGHSRGAAAANLLGMTLDDLYGPEGIFVYTFATPNTYRGSEEDAGRYANIFNFINPADVVTEVPLKAMGYRHIGTDIVLPCEPEAAQRVAEAMQIMAKMSPSIDAYYNDRYSLTDEGAAADGYTAYEIMQALASSLTGLRTDINGGLNLADIYSIMDSSATGSKSEMAPLIELLSRIVGKDGSFGVKIFMQHMPATYTALIDAYEQLLAAYGSGDMSGFGQ